MVGAGAHERLADRPVGIELVALVEQRQVEGAHARDRAGVGLLAVGDQAQERRLAVAVAAHDADAIARGDAERDVGQHGPAAVALGDVLEVDEVAGGGHLVEGGM